MNFTQIFIQFNTQQNLFVVVLSIFYTIIIFLPHCVLSTL